MRAHFPLSGGARAVSPSQKEAPKEWAAGEEEGKGCAEPGGRRGPLSGAEGLGMRRVRETGRREGGLGWGGGAREKRRERRRRGEEKMREGEWGGGRRLEREAGGGRGGARRAFSSLRAPIPPRRPRGRWRGVASRPLPRPLLRPAARPPRRRRSGNMKRRCSCGGSGGPGSSERRALQRRPGRDAAGPGAERPGARRRSGRARGARRRRGSAPPAAPAPRPPGMGPRAAAA